MDRANPPRGGCPSRADWLIPPVLLAAVLAALALVTLGPAGSLLGWTLGLGFAVPAGWLLVSILWPSQADRTCPECGAPGIERLDPSTTRGLLCRSCGWRDETESSFLLAEEEEGPLEQIVLRERGRGTESSVDRSAGTD